MSFKSVFFSLILLSHCAVMAQQQDTIVLSQRGQVNTLYSAQDSLFPDRYRTLVKLTGTSERATCQALKLNPHDAAALEIIKLSMLLNKPMSIDFTVIKERDEQAQSAAHCEVVTVQLRN